MKIDFPAYIPEPVKTHIINYIDPLGSDGWAALLVKWRQELLDIDKKISGCSQRKEFAELDNLRIRKAEIGARLTDMEDTIACMLRLSTDARMSDVFTLLLSEISSDCKLSGFIHAAWGARADYAPYRERVKRAQQLKQEIVDTAAKLARLIRDFSATGVDGPGEFFSVRELLRTTENYEHGGHNASIWGSTRKYVCGDYFSALASISSDPDKEFSIGDWTIRAVDQTDQVDVDPFSMVRYAWGKSPPLHALLETVAVAGREYKLVESGFVGAALAKRQANEKTEYIRAFANLLTESHKVALTPVVMKAMAIAANVALNMPETDVSYDDVRKATI